ncbi:hypothetical protein GM708_05100 [Vibrio cholerae]|nr:hypothetical protein [Vibrio cholerae]
MGITVSTSVLARTKVCFAIIGIGLLALTGCSGESSVASDVRAEADSSTSSPTASSSQTTTPTPSLTPTPSQSPTPSATPDPVVTVSEQWVEEAIPFTSRRQDDPNVDRGVEALAIAGVAGVKATKFQVTSTDGVETDRVAIGEEVRTAPVDEVITVGTKAPVVVAPPAPVEAAVPAGGGCDPNYDGACVPIDSDVDCAGGSGNGPSYVQGPVRVIGTDIYGLDGKDGDGIGCE